MSEFITGLLAGFESPLVDAAIVIFGIYGGGFAIYLLALWLQKRRR